MAFVGASPPFLESGFTGCFWEVVFVDDEADDEVFGL